MADRPVLGLFEGYGIELEYMMVGRSDFKAKPISDQVLRKMAGFDTMSIELGEVAWSNELAMHVIELKSNGPKQNLEQLHANMHKALLAMNKELASFDAEIIPTAMHPLFDPEKELRLWDSEDSEIYASYDRIFGCKGHGWANLQSIHINLPFANDVEFAKLHSAIRLILPLMPAVAASSPLVEGRRGPWLDSRLHFYLKNQRRIGSIIGKGIPEAVYSKADYQEKILDPMYRDIAPLDPDGLLQHEWLNSRAAIARFDRNAIEIRILDIQECLKSDFAVITGFVAMLQTLVAEKWSSFDHQFGISVDALREVLDGVLEQGLNYRIKNTEYLRAFDRDGEARIEELLRHIIERLDGPMAQTFANYRSYFEFILDHGSLASRILTALGDRQDALSIQKVYQQLGQCLVQDGQFQSPI